MRCEGKEFKVEVEVEIKFEPINNKQ